MEDYKTMHSLIMSVLSGEPRLPPSVEVFLLARYQFVYTHEHANNVNSACAQVKINSYFVFPDVVKCYKGNSKLACSILFIGLYVVNYAGSKNLLQKKKKKKKKQKRKTEQRSNFLFNYINHNVNTSRNSRNWTR
ncbi:hypothetical protein POVCU1_004890 [Plasmodium ovale curtisi]|uniref:Uncharacterized protein n=1 Tax=Plasmodium ovale curtisi TaxID=864141 RepID=A0A1A8VLH6_PLAOA|nr:hypothetical protein POVCU1_004890 [Plasmodium ovale curtisi]